MRLGTCFLDESDINETWEVFLDLFDAVSRDCIPKKRGRAKQRSPWITDDIRKLTTKAAFMLILRRQNQRFETLIQNADSKRPSREYCSCFPREEDDFVSMHCALFEAIVRAQVNRKGVYMTSFKRGYM